MIHKFLYKYELKKEIKYIDLVILTVCRSPLSQCQYGTVYYT